MSKTILSRAVLAAALLGAAPALAAVAVGDAVGDTDEAIRQALSGKGCEVRRIEREDGEIEAYALCDGKRLEICMRDGRVLRIKEDD
jgi:hypothetical protein